MTGIFDFEFFWALISQIHAEPKEQEKNYKILIRIDFIAASLYPRMHT
jgi:hypothetical protein